LLGKLFDVVAGKDRRDVTRRNCSELFHMAELKGTVRPMTDSIRAIAEFIKVYLRYASGAVMFRRAVHLVILFSYYLSTFVSKAREITITNDLQKHLEVALPKATYY